MSRAAAALLPIALLAIACGREADSGTSRAELLNLVVSAKPRSLDPAQAGWVGKFAIEHAEFPRLVVHLCDKAIHAARERATQCGGGAIFRRHKCQLNQVPA